MLLTVPKRNNKPVTTGACSGNFRGHAKNKQFLFLTACPHTWPAAKNLNRPCFKFSVCSEMLRLKLLELQYSQAKRTKGKEWTQRKLPLSIPEVPPPAWNCYTESVAVWTNRNVLLHTSVSCHLALPTIKPFHKALREANPNTSSVARRGSRIAFRLVVERFSRCPA